MTKLNWNVLVYSIISLSAIQTVYGNDHLLTVTTSLGNVTGIGINVNGLPGAKTYQFRKIPFASPPLGNLRFSKPQPFGSWNDTLNATVFGPSCMQNISTLWANLLPNTEISEDCLFLNIYVPNGIDKTKNKTVMVWIHGGGYVNGQGMLYHADYMAAKGDVITVTINYRLNTFGFMTLGNDVLKGNYGLWDQILALRWVNENINAFGGDPNSVTIFGESAGGFSVALLALIPSNKGLFHRVIAQSGVGNSFYSLTKIGPLITTLIGRNLQCDVTVPSTFPACLRSKSTEEIFNATAAVYSQPPTVVHLLIAQAPVVDNELFSDMPENLLRNTSSEASKFFRSLDVIIGNVNSEGSLLKGSLPQHIQDLFNFTFADGIPYRVFCGQIIRTLISDYYQNNSKIEQAICKEYGVKNNIQEQARQAINMYTDLFFLSPSVSTLRYHALSNSNTKRFRYLFTHGHGPLSGSFPPWFQGASHASELMYLFGLRDLPQLNISVTTADKILSDAMVTYWTNFAKFGNPNGRSTSTVTGITWPSFDGASESYIVLDYNLTTGAKYNDRRMKFWLNDIPKLKITTSGPSSDGIHANYCSPFIVSFVSLALTLKRI